VDHVEETETPGDRQERSGLERELRVQFEHENEDVARRQDGGEKGVAEHSQVAHSKS
jgi:hypothetical protein